LADRPQHPKLPTQRGHESTSYDTPSALRRAQPASDAPNRFVDDTEDATSVYAIPQVKLRAMSEVASHTSAPQQSLGFLAPPRNPVDVRARKTRDFIVWGSVCVILACFVALGIWFVAK